MKKLVKKIPIIGPALQKITRSRSSPSTTFSGSDGYWKNRYEAGGHSGDGSYNELAEFKAEVINRFVQEKGVDSVIEYGCGDGNQLSLAQYPAYTGFDISATAVELCREKFSGDSTKEFKLMQKYENESADLTLSLDVIYHLVEDSVFSTYMNRLFDSSRKYVIIYSSNTDENAEKQPPHVRHRHFTHWIDLQRPDWALLDHIKNRHPYRGDTKTGSFADFYLFEKKQ